jgi:hypothetical protein
MGGRSPLLALQRNAGNRAATAWVQRACCRSCASGKGCDAERPEEPIVQRLGEGRPTLRPGSNGPAVLDLQSGLNQLIRAGLTPDGAFGGLTAASVRAFQGARGLAPDAIVGPQTWDAFDEGDQVEGVGGGGPAVPGKATDPADDFRIKGLPTDTLDHPDSIFFDFATSEITAETEQRKLDALATDPNELVLEGSSSEEGQGNISLTEARMGAVAQGLRDRAHIGGHTTRNSTSKALGQIDYRTARRVRVTRKGAADPLADCNAKGGSVVDCPPQVNESMDGAIDLLTKALAKLGGPGALSSEDRALILDLFKDDSDAGIGELATHISDLRQYVIDTKAKRQNKGDAQPTSGPFHRCENQCNSTCGAGAFAFNQGVDTESKTVFCDGFSTMSSPPPGTGSTAAEGRVHIAIHEAAHGTKVIDCKDFAKGSERAFRLLTRDQALHNADSFTALARNLVNPGSAATRVINKDTGGRAGDEAVQEPLAWLDRWLEAADFDTSQLYGHLAESQEGRPWRDAEDATTEGYFRRAMRFTSESLAVTAPPAAPVRRDREKMAAINDRYKRVRQVIRAKKAGLAIETGPNLVWEPGPGSALQVPPTFTTAIPVKSRIEMLLAALLHASPEVREEQESGYARLAPKLCDHRAPGFAHSAD